MSDSDIVTRLRGHIAITTRIHYAKDGYPEPVYAHGPSPICQEAADEIERLRMLLCAVESVADAKHDIPTLIRERDEARREVCAYVSGHYNKDVVTLDRAATLEEAKLRGWDCFKEKTP